ncbi:MAG: hypothetical protein KTQ49_05965 [Candidatus Omnitrophica bacterium]|nr:hypothetical protein [Candidatus Omnitrophota bacterium]
MRQHGRFFCVLVLGLVLAGCNTVSKVLPPNDETLVYPLPYDLTYLRTLEALNAQPDWDLEQTEMAKGIIGVRNTNYSNFDDADLRVITFVIKREDLKTTSVSILPKSQHVPGGDKLLEAIGERLGREVSK